MKSLKIRFMFFKNCSNAEPALKLLKDVLNRSEVKADLEVLEIKTEEEAVRYNFQGSPTIQINGMDIDREKRDTPPFFGCRIYRTEKGFSGVPSEEMILAAIEEVLKN